MPKIRPEIGELHRIRDENGNSYPRDQRPEPTYYMNLYTQPLWRHVISRMYHWYDMNKVVIKIAKFYDDYLGYYSHRWWRVMKRKKMSEQEIFWEMPWSAMQDLRCYELSRKGRVDLFRVDITAEQRDIFRRVKTGEYSYPDIKTEVQS